MNKMLLSTLKVAVIFISSGFMAYLVLKAQMKHSNKKAAQETYKNLQDAKASKDDEVLLTMASSKSDTVDLLEDVAKEEIYFDTSKSAPFDLTDEIIVLKEPFKSPQEFNGKVKKKKVEDNKNGTEFFESSKFGAVAFTDNEKEEVKEKIDKKVFFSSSKSIDTIPFLESDDKNSEEKDKVNKTKEEVTAAELIKQQETIKALFEELVRLRKEIASKNAEVQKLKAQMNDKDSEIKTLRQQLSK